MRIRITWQYVVAFVALNMLMGELHEQVHISTGYLICGCYGPRDISTWSICENCASPAWAFMATATGPLFSYVMMWLGVFLFTRSHNRVKRNFGFALLFASLPFARIFTTLMGGGDEKVVFHHVLGDNTPILYAKIIAAVFVISICLPPVLIAARNLGNQFRWLIIAGFLILPLFWGIVYQRLLINRLLEKGIGEETVVLGTPNLVLLHVAVMIVLFLIFRKNLWMSFRHPNADGRPGTAV